MNRMIFKSWSKIILFNTIVFLACLLIIEVIFGEWFAKYNLGPYMREHRQKKNPVTLLHENKEYNSVIKYLGYTIKVYPKKIGRYYIYIADSYNELGDNESAQKYAEVAIKINPEHESVIQMMDKIQK